MEKKRDQVSQKAGRQRELNVIFFVDASKTQSFRISLGSVRILLGLGTCLLLWSFVSSVWLFRSNRSNHELHDKLAEHLDVIFEYQTRYDEVYETAYPRFDESVYERALAKLDANNVTEVEPEEESEDAVAIESPATDTRTLSAKKPVVRTEPDAETFGVRIDEPVFGREGQTLTLTFAIRNNNSPTRTVGFVYGIATFVEQSGAVTYLTAPEGLQVDREGGLVSPRHESHRFSIRYYKGKTFHFVPPEGKQGRFSEVKLYLSKTSGEETSYTLPVEANLGSTGSSNDRVGSKRSRG